MSRNLKSMNLYLHKVNWPFVRRISVPVILLSTGIFLSIAFFLPSLIQVAEFGLDWYGTFRPAVLSGHPYDYPNFFSPPWVIFLLYPFALLPPGVDMIAIILTSLVIWVSVMHRLGGRWLSIFLLLLTPQLWWSFIYGNIDFFIPLGFLLPTPIGLFFFLSKPQVGFGIALYRIIESYQQGGMKKLITTIAPILLVSALFCIPFGFWLPELFDVTERIWNISLFPYLVGVGLILFIQAIKVHKPGLALASSPFLSPYVASWSLPVAILGLLPSQINTILAILSLWAAWLIRGFS